MDIRIRQHNNCIICHYWMIIAIVLPQCHSIIKNGFEYFNNDTYWESLSDFKPITNAYYGNIKLGRSLEMEYKFIYHSRVEYTNDDSYHENAFRIGYQGYDDNTGDGAGSRYPSMWIYYDEGAPNLKFSISNKNKPYFQFTNLYMIETGIIYSVSIKFNQTWIFIQISTESNRNTVIFVNEAWPGTADKYLDTNMFVWISQFGHNYIETPAANITMFDIMIKTWNHSTISTSTTSPITSTPTMISNAPTVNPTNPTTATPTKSPIYIDSMIATEPIELYQFYNESMEQYKHKPMQYKYFIYDAIIQTLENITEHSMNIHDGDMYNDKTWIFGGVHSWEYCMIFNRKINGSRIGCPCIPNAHNLEFQYVAVGLMYVESDGNLTDFRDYIIEQMSLTEFGDIFRERLKEIVAQNEGSGFSVIGDDDDEDKKWMNYLEKIGMILGVLFCVVCMMVIIHFGNKQYKLDKERKQSVNKVSNIENVDDEIEYLQTQTDAKVV